MITKLKSNSAYSALYDPAYTMKTTVNGQLLLCMLSERLMEEIPDCQMIQINTDGMTIKVHKRYVEQMKSICARWEKLTQLELESVKYSKMIIKDVNNYIAVKTDGGVKRKGVAFIYKVNPGELELHKNFSMLVVPKALEAYFVKGIKPEEFVKNHNDIFDFFKRTKVRRSDKLFSRVYDKQGGVSISEEIQRITRYYVSGYVEEEKYKVKSDTSNRMIVKKNYYNKGFGTSLIKEMPLSKSKDEVKNISVESGYLCTVCNDLSLTSDEEIKSKINYQYYIDEVYKVINLVESDYD